MRVQLFATILACALALSGCAASGWFGSSAGKTSGSGSSTEASGESGSAGDTTTTTEAKPSDKPTDNGEGVPGYLTDNADISWLFNERGLTISAPPATVLAEAGIAVTDLVAFVLDAPRLNDLDRRILEGERPYLLQMRARANANADGSLTFDALDVVPGKIAVLIIGTAANFPNLAAAEIDDLVAIQGLARNQFATNPIDENGHQFIELTSGTHHACGLDYHGQVYCWGRGEIGQIGDGLTTDRSTPVALPQQPLVDAGLAGTIVAIEGGSFHNCAISIEGKVFCWGYDTDSLGDSNVSQLCGVEPCKANPVALTGAEDRVFKYLNANGNFSCAQDITNEVFCWGSDGYHQILLPDLDSADTATRSGINDIPGTTKMIALDHQGSACVLQDDGKVYCWGQNNYENLGIGNDPVDSVCNTLPCQTMPLEINLNGNLASKVYSHESHHCAITNGGVYCWGVNWGNKTGSPTPENNKIIVPTLIDSAQLDDANFVRMDLGRAFTCGTTAAGNEVCWGANEFGTLAIDPMDLPAPCGSSCRQTPDESPEIGTAAAPNRRLELGNHFACAIRATTGVIECWGSNNHGQLGRGTNDTFDHQPAPIVLP